jgi:hypothetical protein
MILLFFHLVHTFPSRAVFFRVASDSSLKFYAVLIKKINHALKAYLDATYPRGFCAFYFPNIHAEPVRICCIQRSHNEFLLYCSNTLRNRIKNLTRGKLIHDFARKCAASFKLRFTWMKEADVKDLAKPLISPTTTPTGDLSG